MHKPELPQQQPADDARGHGLTPWLPNRAGSAGPKSASIAVRASVDWDSAHAHRRGSRLHEQRLPEQHWQTAPRAIGVGRESRRCRAPVSMATVRRKLGVLASSRSPGHHGVGRRTTHRTPDRRGNSQRSPGLPSQRGAREREREACPETMTGHCPSGTKGQENWEVYGRGSRQHR